MKLTPLFQQLAIQTRQDALYLQALTHKSFSRDHNERLEYLGDAVLDLVIGEALYHRYPQLREGELSRYRAKLVNTQYFAEKAMVLELPSYLRLGLGEKKAGGAYKETILADALEALFGALYLDLGFDQCKQTILRLFDQDLKDIAEQAKNKDSKTELQEYLQAQKLSLPEYQLLARQGKEHQQIFTIQCLIKDLELTSTAKGRSKKNAEQQAAKAMLSLLAKRKIL